MITCKGRSDGNVTKLHAKTHHTSFQSFVGQTSILRAVPKHRNSVFAEVLSSVCYDGCYFRSHGMARPQTLPAMFLRSLHPVPVPTGRSGCLAWSQGRHPDAVGQGVRPDEDPEGGSWLACVGSAAAVPDNSGGNLHQMAGWGTFVVRENFWILSMQRKAKAMFGGLGIC